MKYYYYEKIAAEMFNIQPKEIFLESRKAIYRIPRQFCMKYQVEKLKYSLTESGKRYNLDHATVISANKRIDNFIATKDDYGKMYLNFLRKCDERKRELEGRTEFLRKVQSVGWYDFVKTVAQPLNELVEMVYKNENEDNIREHIELCEEKIGDLKYLYQIENEPQSQN